ncbi:MAG: radical SAM protein [Erysipelotrichales bacterium]|nr:radical SAM protein [Erysipelotrichales bacterium]
MKFNHVYIEILNYCQFNCSFCPKTKRAKKILNPDEFKHIVKQVKEYTDTIYLHVLGEPLLHDKLDELLQIAENENLKVNITTNGYAINETKHILLKHSNIRKINFSLHSVEDVNHKNISEKEYMNNILTFTSEAVASNITVIYRLWDTNKKDNTMLTLLKEAYPNFEFNHEVSPQNGHRLAYRVFLHQANIFEWPVQSTKEAELEGYCLALKSHIAILSDGTVVPCCLDSEGQINLGNIFESSLTEILHSNLATSIKVGFQNHKAIHPLCKTCSYKDRFEK